MYGKKSTVVLPNMVTAAIYGDICGNGRTDIYMETLPCMDMLPYMETVIIHGNTST